MNDDASDQSSSAPYGGELAGVIGISGLAPAHGLPAENPDLDEKLEGRMT